jgi:hypothetical protein
MVVTIEDAMGSAPVEYLNSTPGLIELIVKNVYMNSYTTVRKAETV